MSIASGMDCNFVTLNMSRVKRLITIDKEIVSGEPVFKGTRVPVQNLFNYLGGGLPLTEFFIDYPSVSKKQVHEAIAIARKFLTSEKLASLYETLTRRKSARQIKTRPKGTRGIDR
jgi:uncharacterized protein (DUF433 family)